MSCPFYAESSLKIYTLPGQPCPPINKDAAYTVSFQAVSAESGDKRQIENAAVIKGGFILKG